MENSKIEWTHHTANLWWGCTKVHDGCDNCYALAQSKRYGFEVWGADKPRRQIINVWKMLEKYQKTAFEKGEIHRVFVGSMMDIFEKPMSLVDSKGAELIEGDAEFWHTGQLRNKFFNEVIPNSPNLMFLLLTKRPSNINKYIPEDWKVNPPNNVMFGTSPVNQKTANMLIQQLAKVNGLRFVSIEPQLEVIDLMKTFGDESLLSMIDWVIQGGESGSGKRPFNTEWARTIRNDCKTENVPYFFKQIDKIQEIPEDLKIREFLQVKTNYEKATIPKVKRTGAVNQKNKDMNEIKFFNVNLNSHIELLVDGRPSPDECIKLIKEDKTEVFYRVISSDILAEQGQPYLDGLAELEDIPNGIVEISQMDFSKFKHFVEADINDEYSWYKAKNVPIKKKKIIERFILKDRELPIDAPGKSWGFPMKGDVMELIDLKMNFQNYIVKTIKHVAAGTRYSLLPITTSVKNSRLRNNYSCYLLRITENADIPLIEFIKSEEN